jgi:arylsulfatase A
MNARTVLMVPVGVVLVLSLRAAPGAQTAPADRPNLILIMADDLGYADLGCYGAREIRTPNIDRLAAGGVRCTQYYASTPVCAPTRVSLLTGRYPARTSLNRNPDWKDPHDGLDPSEVTIAEVLKGAGYATGIVGKWHLGYEKKFWPLQQGFDEYFGFISGWADYYKHTYRPEAGNWMVRNNERRDEPGYMTDLLTREAVSFIDRRAADKKPFFLHLAYNAPHTPFQPPPNCEKIAHADVYRAMVESLDAGVGKVLDAVDHAGIAGNTFVVFTSDHGAETGGGNNGPLRGFKRSVYEGGIRVPFIARFAGRIPAHTTTDKIAISMDVFATFAALAGAEPPKNVVIDGKDILPMLSGKGPSPHADSPLFWAFGQQDAVRLGKWKLIREKGKPVGLFDIPADEGETHDVSARHPGLVAEMSRQLDTWRKSMRNPAASG